MQDMLHRHPTLILLAAILALTGCTSCGGGNAAVVVPPTPTRPSFDRSLAFDALIHQCSYGSRRPGSDGHETCRAWLVAQLTPLADRVVEQGFNSRTPLGGPYDFSNIVGVFGTDVAGSPLLLAAHWDTRPLADQDPDPTKHDTAILGANDGASGVAVLLELARLMKDHKPSRPVIIAFLDAEDSGVNHETTFPYLGFCIGSNYLATHWPVDVAKPSEMVLLDMVGTDKVRNPRLQAAGQIGPPEFKLEQNSLSSDPTLVNSIWSAAESHGHTAFERTNLGTVIDDHKPFIDNGIPGVDIIHFAPAEWHTADDTPEHCSADTLFQVGDTLVDILWK